MDMRATGHLFEGRGNGLEEIGKQLGNFHIWGCNLKFVSQAIFKTLLKLRLKRLPYGASKDDIYPIPEFLLEANGLRCWSGNISNLLENILNFKALHKVFTYQ